MKLLHCLFRFIFTKKKKNKLPHLYMGNQFRTTATKKSLLGNMTWCKLPASKAYPPQQLQSEQHHAAWEQKMQAQIFP